MPRLAHFSAATDVCDCGDDSAIDHAKNIRIEKHVDRDAVRAVSVKIERAGAIEFGAFEVQNGDGDLYSVGRDRIDLFDFILLRIVSAGNFFLLQQSGCAGLHVVGEDRGRRDGRLVSVTEIGGVVDAVDVGVGGVSGLGEGDALGLPVAEIDDADLRQSAFALEKDAEVLEELHLIDHDGRILRHDFVPVGAARVGNRSGHEAEVASGIVDADVERISVVIGIIFDALLARLEDLPVRIGLFRWDVAGFARGVTCRDQKDVGVAERFVGSDIKFLVRFFVDENVGGGRTCSVAIETILPFFDGIFLGVEDRLIVFSPDHGADPFGVIGQRLAAAEIFDREIVLPESCVVVAISEQVAVRADSECRNRHEDLALREFVDIKKDLFGRVHAGFFAAANGVLLAGLDARVIEVVAFAVWNFDVGFFHAAQHLVIELFLEGLGGFHHRVGVGVFGFEIGTHFGIRFVAQPEIVVGERAAVDFGDVRDFLRDRWRRKIVGGCEEQDRERDHGSEMQYVVGHEGAPKRTRNCGYVVG